MTVIAIKPKQVTNRLLKALPPRAKDIIVGRFGLGSDGKRLTLEAIGKSYKITRERVRQIEEYSLNLIRKSSLYAAEKKVFEELKKFMHQMGALVPEKDFLNAVAKDKLTQNHIHFLLVVGEDFKKSKEDDDFEHRWSVNDTLSTKIHASLKKLYQGLKDDEIIPESEIINMFLEDIKDVSEEYKKEEIIRRWLGMSKKLGKNPLGEWGKAHSGNVKTKGIRDYAFLAIRKHGSPVHFREVAKIISDAFGKKAHVATCHNELIKDKRFVLVGRGLYALAEWGYVSGVVKDVIKHLIEKHGPMTKDQIIEKVMKERYVKPNTILVNLQNPKHFKKDKDGKYHTV